MNFLYGNLLLMLYDSCGYELELRLLPSNIYTEVSAYIIVCSYDIRDSLDKHVAVGGGTLLTALTASITSSYLRQKSL